MQTPATHIALAALAAAFVLAVPTASATPLLDEEMLEGRAPTAEELRPSVEAAFAQESYASGDTATLTIFNRADGITFRVFHTGPERTATGGANEMRGVPVTRAAVATGRRISIRVGDWPSGLYFARLTASDGRVGFAPFVVRPPRLGAHAVAVVLPTMTWQAYNLRGGDSWYASWNVKTARLARPFLNRGVPYNFRRYDLPFLHWLAWTGRGADVLSDADLDGASGDELADAYRLIVFPGHHEYVTEHEYDAIERFRDRGGNLAFLSANNFFWRTVRDGETIERTRQWRDLDRPESRLIGVDYRGNDRGTHRAPWIVRDARAAPWLFEGTGLADGDTFGSGGIEIDHTSPSSPAGVHVLAEIPDLFGPGFTAQLTYYELPRGAKVFAAGAFNFTRELETDPVADRLVGNLWKHLARP
jgi:hypothetical protein